MYKKIAASFALLMATASLGHAVHTTHKKGEDIYHVNGQNAKTDKLNSESARRIIPHITYQVRSIFLYGDTNDYNKKISDYIFKNNDDIDTALYHITPADKLNYEILPLRFDPYSSFDVTPESARKKSHPGWEDGVYAYGIHQVFTAQSFGEYNLGNPISFIDSQSQKENTLDKDNIGIANAGQTSTIRDAVIVLRNNSNTKNIQIGNRIVPSGRVVTFDVPENELVPYNGYLDVNYAIYDTKIKDNYRVDKRDTVTEDTSTVKGFARLVPNKVNAISAPASGLLFGKVVLLVKPTLTFGKVGEDSKVYSVTK